MNKKRDLDKKKLDLVNRVIKAVTGKRKLEAIASKNDMLSAIISAEKIETLEVIEKNMDSLAIWRY